MTCHISAHLALMCHIIHTMLCRLIFLCLPGSHLLMYNYTVVAEYSGTLVHHPLLAPSVCGPAQMVWECVRACVCVCGQTLECPHTSSVGTTYTKILSYHLRTANRPRWKCTLPLNTETKECKLRSLKEFWNDKGGTFGKKCSVPELFFDFLNFRSARFLVNIILKRGNGCALDRYYFQHGFRAGKQRSLTCKWITHLLWHNYECFYSLLFVNKRPSFMSSTSILVLALNKIKTVTGLSQNPLKNVWSACFTFAVSVFGYHG